MITLYNVIVRVPFHYGGHNAKIWRYWTANLLWDLCLYVPRLTWAYGLGFWVVSGFRDVGLDLWLWGFRIDCRLCRLGVPFQGFRVIHDNTTDFPAHKHS